MPWLFGRRRRKAAKLNDAVTDRKRPVAEQTNATQHDNGPQRGSSQRNGRRRRGSSRSTQAASMRDVEKPLPGGYAKDAWPPSSAEDINALPSQRRLAHSPHLRPITQEHAGLPYSSHSHSHSSLPPSAKERGKLQRPQSMRRDPPTDSSLVRRKSSKRRREHDLVREEEIRAMSLPMPQKRPAANSGAMLRGDSKKVKAGLNHRFNRPTSNASLPLGDSAHSSMSGSSDSRAFRVSAFDMFAPRPTIRVSVGSNYHAGDRSSPNTYSEKSNTRRERRPISSQDDRQSKRTSRIDDLADDLDAGALRDILERDKRRRDKKAKADQDRLRRRLERRAEKQNATEVKGTPATPRREGIGLVGLGIGRDAPMPMEDVRPSTPPQPQQPQRLQMPVTPQHEYSQLPTPLDSPAEEAVVSDARAIRYSRGSAHVHTRGPSNASILPELISEKVAYDTPVESIEHVHDPTRSGSLHPVETVDTMSTSKMGSTRRRSSEGRRMGVFASLFRRGKRSSQDQPQNPSEISFSNTSRESMSRQPLPAHLVGTLPASQPIQIRRPSSLPRRTMSKFREDLPEFPLSPPDSRVQSPEVPMTSAIAARRRSQHPSDLRVGSLPGDRSDSPVSPGALNGNVMSQSLASVDSEGSWLSGRPPKRASNRSQMRSSLTSSAVHANQDFNASYEELGMADEEFFKKLTPLPDERRRSPYASDEKLGKASSTLMTVDAAAESDDEVEPTPARRPSDGEEEELVQSSVGRQPTIIHRRPRVKSAEGLLSMFLDDTETSSRTAERESESPESPISPVSDNEPVTVQRAKSVDLGKNHVRHLSAGSARLLDIQKRSSTPVHGRSPSRMSEQD